MDKQLVFFLALAFLLLFGGIFSMNLVMQLSGVVVLVFLIYSHVFYHKENAKYRESVAYEEKYFGGINFVGFLGNIDLTLGILLLVRSIYGIIPMGLILFLVILLFLKAFTFVWGGDVASILDVISSVAVFASVSVEIPSFVFVVISIYLIQKGLLSYLN